jgi:hypothetical protein
MADITVDGTTRVAWVPTIANIASPTVAELNAGILLTSTLTPDGLMNFVADTADVPNDSLASTYDTVDNGRDSFKNTTLRLKKQDGVDTVYTTLVKNATGNVVVRRDIDRNTGWASSQGSGGVNGTLAVFPAKCARRRRLDPAKNEVTKYEVPVKIYAAPNEDAVVA